MISRALKFSFTFSAVATLLFFSGATFAGLSPVSPDHDGFEIQPNPPISGGGDGNHSDTQHVWANTASDYNANGSWAATAPAAGDVGAFNTAPTMQPVLTSSLSNAGLFFSAISGYDLSASAGATLTLTGVATSAGGAEASNSNAAAIGATNVSGSNTIDAPIFLSPASGVQSSFVQSPGGTLIVNGAISSALGINLSLRGGGTIQLNGANSFTTASIDTANETVILGNDSALGVGSFVINNTSTLQASGGPRSIANPIFFNGNTTISGTNAFTFTGPVAAQNSNSRTLTVTNTGGVTFNGSVALEEVGASAGRGLIINGNSPVTFNGVISNGDSAAAFLKYSGTSTLTLNNSNTFSGGFSATASGAAINANADGALGLGNVSLTAGLITLTLQNGVTQNYIADSGNLSIVTNDTVNLNFVGVDTIGALIVNGVSQPLGLYGASATNPNGEFSGTGLLLVTAIVAVPEHSTWTMLVMGAALLLGVQRWRRRRTI